MNIDTYIQQPSCTNASDASIYIKSIHLDSTEIKDYINYYIEWSNNISTNNIRHNAAVNLTTGTYSYRLVGQFKTSEWFYVEVKEPDSLMITNIISQYNCENDKLDLEVFVTGGTPPYIGRYDTQLSFSTDNKLTFKNISYSISDKIKLTDNNNCFTESNDIVVTHNGFFSVDLVSVSPPNVCYDHPSACSIQINGNSGPYRLEIKELDKDEYVYIDEIQNTINEYSLSDIVYPGIYTLRVTNKYGCTKFLDINIPNRPPLSAQITYKHNQILEHNIISSTEKIINTIFIPYNLLINNSDLIEWFEDKHNNQELDIVIGNKKYNQKIKHNYLNKILILGQSSNEWYYPIIIRKGFDINKDQNLFTESIKINIAQKEYNAIPEFDTSANVFQLIRSNILSTTTNTNDFIKHHTLKLYEKINNQYSYLITARYTSTEYFLNSYIYGNLFGISILDDEKYMYKIHIKNHTLPLLSDKDIKYVQDLKDTLTFLNDWNKDIYISPDILQNNNGRISILSNQETDISYKKYDPINKTVSDIYFNNQIAKIPFLLNLSAGIYVIKITDSYKNKLKILNNQSYDSHYEAAISFIQKQLDVSPDIVHFDYGDILINLLDYNTLTENTSILGLKDLTNLSKTNPS